MTPSSIRKRLSALDLNKQVVKIDLLTPTPPCTPVQSSSTSPIFPPVLERQISYPEAHVYQNEGQPKQSNIDGEIWPPIFKTEFVRTAKEMVPRDDDVFVCTYPKCGTTWIQHICSQLLHDNYTPEAGKELSMTSPMIERMGAKFAEELNTPRLLKTHFNYINCPKSEKAKYIFCVRNPKDCLTSYYFHNKNFKIYDWEDGKFNVFFDMFMNAELGFGDYFEHLLSWLPHITDDNVLFLKYEDMLEDLETAVKKIGNFIGGRAAELVNDPNTLQHVVAESRVDAMKKNQTRWFPGSVLRQQTFIRKGIKRDWKNYFTKEQSNQLDQKFQEMFKGTLAEKWWRNEMSWDDLPEEKIPDIEITLSEPTVQSSEDDGIYSDDSDEPMPSVSRRGSNANTLEPPRRRGSADSLLTSLSLNSVGYGSTWDN